MFGKSVEHVLNFAHHKVYNPLVFCVDKLQVCASNFGEMCSVLGPEVTSDRMVSKNKIDKK